EALVDSAAIGSVNTPADFDREDIETYILEAQAATLAALQDLNANRQGKSDAELKAAVNAAQAVINKSTTKLAADGTIKSDPAQDIYTLKNLQNIAVSAQKAVDAHVAARGKTEDLASQLLDAVVIY